MTYEDAERCKNLLKIIQENPSIVTIDLVKSLLAMSGIYCSLNKVQQLNLEKNNLTADVLQSSNLAMSAYNIAVTKLEINKIVRKQLDEKIQELQDKAIEYINEIANSDEDPTGEIIGDTFISSQIYNSNRSEESDKKAIENNFPVVKLNDCVDKVKNDNNISKDQKLNISKTQINSDGVKQVGIGFHAPETSTKLDTSACNGATIKFPMDGDKNNAINMTRYNEFRNESIDIYDPNDPIFTSRCYPFSLNGYDTTINMRRRYLYPNNTVACSNGCMYKGFDENNYIQCDCPSLSDSNIYTTHFIKDALEMYDGLNTDIVECAGRAFNRTIVYNSGFYYCISLVLLFVLLFPLVIRLKNNLKRIIYNDGCFYNRDIDPEFYFFKRLGIVRPPKIVQEEDDDADSDDDDGPTEPNLNSSRDLKQEVPQKDEVLVLVDNKFINKDTGRDCDAPVNDFKVVLAKSEVTKGDEIVTYNDYFMLRSYSYFDYDLRGFRKYLKDELCYNHSIVKLFVKDSIIDPRHISFIKLVFRMNLTISLNAFTFMDNYIEERAANPIRVPNINNI
jgi:hypothetical protein